MHVFGGITLETLSSRYYISQHDYVHVIMYMYMFYCVVSQSTDITEVSGLAVIIDIQSLHCAC